MMHVTKMALPIRNTIIENKQAIDKFKGNCKAL